MVKIHRSRSCAKLLVYSLQNMCFYCNSTNIMLLNKSKYVYRNLMFFIIQIVPRYTHTLTLCNTIFFLSSFFNQARNILVIRWVYLKSRLILLMHVVHLNMNPFDGTLTWRGCLIIWSRCVNFFLEKTFFQRLLYQFFVFP